MSIAGDWRLEITFLLGAATHALHLQERDGQVEGRYRTRYGEQEIRGRLEAGRRAGARAQSRGGYYEGRPAWAAR